MFEFLFILAVIIVLVIVFGAFTLLGELVVLLFKGIGLILGLVFIAFKVVFWVLGVVLMALFNLGLIAAVVFGLLVLIASVRMLRRGGKKSDGLVREEDALHRRVRRGMNRMERRMRDLETILARRAPLTSNSYDREF